MTRLVLLPNELICPDCFGRGERYDGAQSKYLITCDTCHGIGVLRRPL